MNNVYLVPHEDGTYEACIAPVAPSENAVLLTPEGEYPVECYYRRFDLNGDGIIEMYTCSNRDELIHGLNSDGTACHTIRGLWDFDSYKAKVHDAWLVFNAATDKVMKAIALEWEKINLCDSLRCVMCEPLPYEWFAGDATAIMIEYVREHGYHLEFKEEDDMICVTVLDSENGIVANNAEELISKVRLWNYELLVDEEVDGERREKLMEDAVVLDELEEMISERIGYPLGYLTVKELIEVLSKMPKDYRVSCCGAENYMYLNVKDKFVTIDNEYHLG